MPDTATLTVAQVAERLHVSVKTVRGFIRSRALKASNVGTRNHLRYVIREGSLEAFLEAREMVGIEEEGTGDAGMP